jgi:hypothetical protein
MIDVCPYKRPDERTVTSLEGLLYFVWEREAIRVAKEGGWPVNALTNDPVLKKYKFTNIRRRDDRVSQWIIEHLIKPNAASEDLWFTLLIARIINWPPTLQALLHEKVIPCAPEDFDAELFSVTIEALKANGTKVYSGAYMVYPTKMDVGGNKSSAIAKHILGGVIERAEDIWCSLNHPDADPSVERFVESLSKCFGLSTFMAGQVAADLTYGDIEFEDIYSYAPIGPGSSRGLNYLKGRRPFASWGQGDFNNALIDIHHEIEEHLDIKDMTLHDVQNVMCEFSKYCRCVLNEGVPKTIYKPEELF